ncbi:MAG: hypothetical protein IGS48_24420 [Oscillatoriales cyanobacterium C42_A2020_001]|nr:hypothetical protein [Leptolyngbyaceae cyanobacterium C42_A2020_001]
MKKLVVTLLASLLTVGSLAACSNANQNNVQSSNAQPSNTPNPQSESSTNLVGLFIVKKDNTTGDYRGELFPIALHLNGSYVDVSQDVTLEMRDNYAIQNLVYNHQTKSFLNAIKQFTILDQSKQLGQFAIKQLGVTQFACSAFLVGQGDFSGNQTLNALYDAIPEQGRSGSYSGKVGDKQVDESWRWILATSQYTAPPASKLPTQIDVAKYQQDLLAAANPLLAQSEKSKAIAGEMVVERSAIYDLNHDGQPEVFGTIRKGKDPKTTPPERMQKSTAYINVWLSYANNKPTVIANQVEAYEIPVSRQPYEVLAVMDMNRDGIDEVIVRNVGYESFSFGIHELRNNQLVPVFNGAGYGC